MKPGRNPWSFFMQKFARACEEEGVSQASQLTKMMKEFVEKRK